MFTAQQALFLYAVSPVHMGAGTALGLIDSPIQREKHTEHPMIAGAGLKGAIRHRFWGQSAEAEDRELLNCYFGPDTNASDYAGAVSFSDAQLVAFPVRCGKAGFVYATSPLALARMQRLLSVVGVTGLNWDIPQPASGEAGCANADLLIQNMLHVDTFELAAQENEKLKGIAQWLSENALSEGVAYEFFRGKLATDLVLMNDDDFGYFVRNATVVEPHVRIKNETGAAERGGLFYIENLPPESLLLSVVMASDERSKRKDKANAQEILQHVVEGHNDFGGLNGKLLQVGGDATTGRGHVVVSAVKSQGEA